MLDAQWLVQIYAYDLDNDPCIGTGYSLGLGLILTARHVVLSSNRHSDPRLRLVWPNLKTGNKDFEMPFGDGDIVFHCPDSDLAVIRCPMQMAFEVPQVRLAKNSPIPTAPWSNRGFLRAAKDGDTRPDQGFSGTVQGVKDGTIELNTPVAVTQENGWAGLSGSPVFVNNELVAIITDDFKTLKTYLIAYSLPYLRKNNSAFDEVIKIIDEAFNTEQTQKLYDKLTAEVAARLQNNHIPIDPLTEILQLGRNCGFAEVAKYLVKERTTGQAIGCFVKLSTELETYWQNKPERWDNYLNDVEQVCGWLLLKSVNPEWWLANENLLQNPLGITNQFILDNRAYIEVIISRWLLQQPRFSLDDGNNVKPMHQCDVFLFDASPKATDIQLLSILYRDLKRGGEPPQNIEKLLKAISVSVRSYHEDLGKPIYYLVTQDYLEQLKSRDWFKGFESELKRSLQLICYDLKTDSSEINASQEDQDILMEKIASILRFKITKGSQHV